MKRLFAMFLVILLCAGSAAADPVTSYAAVQDQLAALAYKLPPFKAALSGTIYAVVPSYTFKNTFYLFVLVDPKDVTIWSTEDDNFFVTVVSSEKDPLPFEVGEEITVEGEVVSLYSSPACPYITAERINGSDDF